MTSKTVDVSTGCIAVFCTDTTIDITYPTLVHTLLHGQVEHGFFFTIVDTGDAGIVRLTIVCIDFLNHVYRKVLQTGFHVSTEEFFTVHHQLLDFLTVDLHITVIVHFGTRQFLHQFFQHGTFRSTIGRCIITQCITRNGYLRSFCGNHGFAQHDGIRRQGNLADIQGRFRSGQLILLFVRKITHERHLQYILTRTSRQAEVTTIIGHITYHHRTIGQ